MRSTNLAKIRRDKAELLQVKKLAQKFTDGMSATPQIVKPAEAEKAAMQPDSDEVLYRTIVANTYNYMDSHDDVHVKGIFTKSINETKKIFLLHDHEFKITSQIGTINQAYEKSVSWKEVGLDKSGMTTALLLDSSIEKAKNAAIFDAYKNGEINQHSVGMQYVKIDLAIDDKEDKEAFALYSSILPTLGNADKAEEQGYFFVVSEAKLRETSAVLMGSNDLTGVLSNSHKELNVEQIFNYLSNKFENKEIVFNLCEQFVDTFKHLKPTAVTSEAKKPSFFELMSK